MLGSTDRRKSFGATPIVPSVLANWSREFVSIAAGFILPRLVDTSMGTAELGVWDFGWSARSIIAMSALGMSSSVGHHVSRFRSAGDWPGLNRVLSATLALVLYTAALAIMITVAAALSTPWLMTDSPAALSSAARRVVLAMGLAATLQMVTQIWGGVIVGSHRFVLLNAVEIAADVLMMSGLFVSVLADWGLQAMALFVLARQVVDIVAKWMIAHRICPALRLRPQWTDWQTFRTVASYGGKTLTEAFGTTLCYQAVVPMLMFYHGPEAVALYARPRALVLFTTRFLMGFARVLVPKAGELCEQANRRELGALLLSSTQQGMYLTFPIVIVLLVMGGPVLRLWMGDAYADPTVLTILVLGYAAYFAQRPTWHVLLGVGSHGAASIAVVAGGVVSVGLSALFIGPFGWGLPGAALGVAIPVAIVNSVALPMAGCRVTGVPLGQYFATSLVAPSLAILPFAITLIGARLLLLELPLIGLLVGLCVGAPVLLLTYWRSVLPDAFKAKVKGRLGYL